MATVVEGLLNMNWVKLAELEEAVTVPQVVPAVVVIATVRLQLVPALA